jgi:hypothetical protein
VLSCDLSFKNGKDNDACGFALLGLLEPQRHLSVEPQRLGLAVATNAAGAQRSRAPHPEGANATLRSLGGAPERGALGSPAAVGPAEVPERLGISAERWREIGEACGQRVVVWQVE